MSKSGEAYSWWYDQTTADVEQKGDQGLTLLDFDISNGERPLSIKERYQQQLAEADRRVPEHRPRGPRAPDARALLRLHPRDGYFAAAHRLLKPGGFFDFTYHHTESEPWDFLQEDYYYPTELLLRRAADVGFEGFAMEDWVYSQSKIRLVKPDP